MSGKEVWILLGEEWVRAAVVSSGASGVTVIDPTKPGGGNKLTLRPESLGPIVDESHLQDHDDICKVNNLHLAPLISILSMRFSRGQIYTRADSVLISLNPLRSVPGLDDFPSLYIDMPDDGDGENGEVPSLRQPLRPHVYSISNEALSKMVATNKSSSIVVSGESGSGKTEAVKRCMRFLILADAEMSTKTEGVKGAEAIKERISSSNILFEQLGNAKTIRNNNSSRFGRYIKLQYDDKHRLTSAAVQTFLLEKSRIGRDVASGERCFHVFYALLRGQSLLVEATTSALNLFNHPASSFAMLTDTQGVAHAAAEEDDAFPNLCSALAAVETTEEEMRELWQLLGVLLHLGNCRFGEEGEIESPLVSLPEIASFLKLDPDLLTKALTRQVLQAGGRTSVHTKILSPAEAVYNLQALIRFLYGAVFEWVVGKVNASFSTRLSTPDVVPAHSSFIGLLDIFGFEILQTNSLEQLLINFTNERLQQQFNEHIFVLEQREYAAEGLDCIDLQFSDNSKIIDLFCKKNTGLFSLLEEQAMLQRTDDAPLLVSFVQRHAASNTLSASRFKAQSAFCITHYAGVVEYTIGSFLTKNNDALQEDTLLAILSTKNPFIFNVVAPFSGLPGLEGKVGEPGYLPAPPPASSGSGAGAGAIAGASRNQAKMAAASTVSSLFRVQLDNLVSTLWSTNLHFVKCIKPNDIFSPLVFDSARVSQQLLYSGALELVRIRREGYPYSATDAVFMLEFKLLAKARQFPRGVEPSATTICSTFLAPGQFAMGREKLFLRGEGYDLLLQRRDGVYHEIATKLQATWRAYFCHVRYISMLQQVVLLQRLFRGFPMRLNYLRAQQDKRLQEMKCKEAEANARLAEAERAALELAQQEEKARVEAEAARVAAEVARVEAEKRQFEASLYAAAAKGDVEYLQATSYGDEHRIPLLHAAVTFNSLSVVHFLNPLASETTAAHGKGGLNALHCCRSWRILCALLDTIDRATPGPGENSGAASVGAKFKQKQTLAVAGGALLKEGWLSKRGESSSWRRRYVKLKLDSLSYYHAPTDLLPRDVVSFEKNQGSMQLERFAGPGGAPALTIKLAAVSGQKKRSKIDLMASSEEELLSWLLPLKSLAGLIGKGGRSNGGVPARYVSFTAREAALSLTTSTGNTLLHLLSAEAEEGGEQLLLASALLHFGLSPVSCTNKEGRSAKDLAADTGRSAPFLRLLSSYGSLARRPPFVVLPDYSYLHLFVAELVFAQPRGKEVGGDTTRLSVRVVDSASGRGGKSVEEAQVISALSESNSRGVIWGQSIWLKVPLDNYEASFEVVLAVDTHSVVIDTGVVDSTLVSRVMPTTGDTVTFSLSLYQREM